jgi:hypothetical protein
MLPYFVAPRRDALSGRLDNEFPILGESFSVLSGGRLRVAENPLGARVHPIPNALGWGERYQ